MPRTTILVLTLLLLVIPATAQARGDGAHQRPVDDGLALALVEPATAFWTNLGRNPSPVTLYFADLSGLDDGTGVMGARGQEVWIDEAWWAEIRGVLARGRHATLSYRRNAITTACTLMTHELGHTLGLPHGHDGGIMDETGPSGPPGICAEFAASVLPSQTQGHECATPRRS